ncbi:MAG: hypothetical protein AAF409_04275 [Pseudomonadota bacterium]
MRRLRWLIQFGAAVVVLAGCAVRGTPISGQVVDRSYSVGGFSWQSGATVFVLMKTFNSDGKVGLCGAWTARGGANLVSHLHTQALEAGSVILDGSRVHQGLRFMKWHAPDQKLGGKATNCIRTGTDWRPGFEGAKP